MFYVVLKCVNWLGSYLKPLTITCSACLTSSAVFASSSAFIHLEWAKYHFFYLLLSPSGYSISYDTVYIDSPDVWQWAQMFGQGTSLVFLLFSK